MILPVGGPRNFDRLPATSESFELLEADKQYVPFSGNNDWPEQQGLTHVYIWNQSPDAEYSQRIYEEIQAGTFQWPEWPENE